MFVSLDLETTGFDPVKDKIIEFGAIKFDLGGEIERLRFFVNPGINIPQIVTHITSITDEDLHKAPTIADKTPEIINFIGNLPIVGHNIQFDTGFLKGAGFKITNPEYDTQELSGILLPGLPSYSLEILSQTLDLKHKEKHRALDDAIAAMELFLKLIEKFRGLEPKLLKEIQNLCKKSDWSFKDLITKITTKNKPTLHQTAKSLSPETSFIKNLLKTVTPDGYISLPYHTFRQIHYEIPDSFAKIDIHKNYVSTERLKKFSQKAHFENHELTALLKHLVWIEQTNTGLLSEIKLFNEERNIIGKINIDESIAQPERERFIKKALEKDKKSPAVCTHEYTLENPQKNYTIIDLESFAKTLHYKLSIHLKLIHINKILDHLGKTQVTEILKTKSTILFGLIGIIFKRSNNRDRFRPSSTIKNEILNTKEWLGAKDTVKNLIEASQALGEIKNNDNLGYLKSWKKILEDLHEIFVTPKIDKNLIWIEKDQYDELALRQVPFSINQELRDILANSRVLTQNANELQELFALQDLKIENLDKKRPGLEILIAENNHSDDRNILANFFKDYLAKTKEKIAIIFNARDQLQFFTLKLSQENLPIISQLTASQGKIEEQFKTSKKPLLLTPPLWKNFAYQNEIDTLLIHKIPFDPPSDPLLIALSQNFQDPFNELQVPRAIIALKKMIDHPLKKVIILDSRLSTKNYGPRFLKGLEEVAKTVFFSIDFFPDHQ